MECLNAGVDVMWMSVRKRGIAIYTSKVSVRPSWRHLVVRNPIEDYKNIEISPPACQPRADGNRGPIR